MTDKNTIINGLKNQIHDLRTYADDGEVITLTVDQAEDIVSLLEEQEAKPMTEYDDGWDCPKCGLKLIGKTASGYPYNWLDLPSDEIVKYCPICGQKVKWNE